MPLILYSGLWTLGIVNMQEMKKLRNCNLNCEKWLNHSVQGLRRCASGTTRNARRNTWSIARTAGERRGGCCRRSCSPPPSPPRTRRPLRPPPGFAATTRPPPPVGTTTIIPSMANVAQPTIVTATGRAAAEVPLSLKTALKSHQSVAAWFQEHKRGPGWRFVVRWTCQSWRRCAPRWRPWSARSRPRFSPPALKSESIGLREALSRGENLDLPALARWNTQGPVLKYIVFLLYCFDQYCGLCYKFYLALLIWPLEFHPKSTQATTLM